MQENYIIDVSMIGLDGSPRVYDNIHPCITQRLYKEPTMVCLVQYLGTVNIGGTGAFTKYTKEICKTLKAQNHDICAVETIKLSERIDMINDTNTITKQVEVIGCMDNKLDNTFESANRVYDLDGICPTIPTCGGGGIQPKILEVKKLDVNELGFIDNSIGKHQSNTVFGTGVVSPTITTIQGGGTQQIKVCDVKQLGHIEKGTGKHQSNIIYDKDGVSPCICAGMGIKQQPTMFVEEKKICAMRGRNSDNPSDRTAGINLEQTLEIRSDDCCGCLTSVQKDNLVFEKKCIKIRQATKDGFIDCEIGGGWRIWNIQTAKQEKVV